jgi:hypothetical protein
VSTPLSALAGLGASVAGLLIVGCVVVGGILSGVLDEFSVLAVGLPVAGVAAATTYGVERLLRRRQQVCPACRTALD